MHWKALVAFLTLASVMMSSSYTMLVPFLPLYLIEELHVASEDVNLWSGLIFSSTFFISAIMAPIWGAIADRNGRKMMALRAAVCLAIGYIWAAFVQSPEEFLAMRCFHGFSAGLWPACLAIMTASVPREKMGWCLGLMQGGLMGGNVLGPLFGGLLAEAVGMRVSFLVGGIALSFIAIGIIFLIKEDKSQLAKPSSDKNAPRTTSWQLVKVPVIARLLFASCIIQMAVMLVQPILPLYVAELQGSMENIVLVSGIVFSVVGVSGVLASPIWGRAGTNVGYRWALYVAIFGTGIFGIIQGIPETLFLFVVWRFVGGIFYAGVAPCVNALLAENTLPSERGRIYGISYSAQQVGSVMGPLLGGVLATYWGNTAVVMSHGVVLLVLVAFLYLMRPKNATPGSGETIETQN